MNEAGDNFPLQVRGIGRRLANTDDWLLRDIVFDIEGGSRIAIVGPTGSGKTLLLRAIVRLDRVDVGEILWRGMPVQGNVIPLFRQQAIYLHQRPALLEGTVEDNLRLPFSLRCHRERKFSLDTVLTLLGRVQRTEDFLRRSAHELSGGEAQIVALVRAIQLRPWLLLLDEPTAALDSESTQMIEQLVSGWFEESPAGRAYAWVSHDKRQVARIADRVMTMSGGRLSDDAQQIKEQLP